MNPHTHQRAGHSAFTLTELLAVIAIIGILAAIIIPIVGKVRHSASKTQCRANLRQTGLAYLLWANDYKGKIPNKYSYQTSAEDFNFNDINLGTSLILGAPLDPDGNPTLHAPTEISPFALKSEAFTTRYRSPAKSGFFTSVSYYPLGEFWVNTILATQPVLNDRGMLREIPPPKAVLLGVAKTDYLAPEGSSGAKSWANLKSWATGRFEDYGDDTVFLAFFDGHVAAVAKDRIPMTIRP